MLAAAAAAFATCERETCASSLVTLTGCFRLAIRPGRRCHIHCSAAAAAQLHSCTHKTRCRTAPQINRTHATPSELTGSGAAGSCRGPIRGTATPARTRSCPTACMWSRRSSASRLRGQGGGRREAAQSGGGGGGLASAAARPLCRRCRRPPAGQAALLRRGAALARVMVRAWAQGPSPLRAGARHVGRSSPLQVTMAGSRLPVAVRTSGMALTARQGEGGGGAGRARGPIGRLSGCWQGCTGDQGRLRVQQAPWGARALMARRSRCSQAPSAPVGQLGWRGRAAGPHLRALQACRQARVGPPTTIGRF